MPDINEIQDWYNEADSIHSDWTTKAQEDWAFYNGDQWDASDKARLEKLKRPVLTLNYLRSLIRLMVGYEMRTRYNIKVYPVGEEGDDDKARLLTRLMHGIERTERLDYVSSDVYKHGLVCGRGWFKVYVDYDFNLLGDIKITTDDAYYIKVDPYGRRLDMLDHRYLFVEHWYDERDVKRLYPDIDIDELQMSADTTRKVNGRQLYQVKECWYREYKVERLLINKQNYEMYRVTEQDDEEVIKRYISSGNYALYRRKVPQVYYVVLSGEEILEEAQSPYKSPYFPYVLYTPEFLPSFGDENDPDWVGIIRDLKDPQRDINKRRSQWLDILARSVNTGWITTKNNIVNKQAIQDLQTKPGVIIEVLDFNKIREKRSEAPHPALFTTGQQDVEDLRYISGINPAQLGFSVGTRESGKSLLIKQQSGAISITPYQDNLRLARLIVARLVLSLIPQVYNASRIARVIAPDGTLMTMKPEELQAIQQILSDVDIGRYDVALSDTPSTPTQRVAEFVELKEIIGMLMQAGMPPNLRMLEALVNASDVSQKKQVLAALQEQFQQAQQAAQMAAMTQGQ